MTVAMALAEAQHHAAPRRQKPASAITVNDASRGQKNADAEYFELSSDEEVASARGMRPAPLWEPRPQERVQRHRVLRACADPRSRRSRAADGRTVGGCLESLRPVAARAGYRSAQDHSSGWGLASCCSSQAAAGGTVGGSADYARVRTCGGCRANPWVEGSKGSTSPGQGGIQILATATVADVAVADVSVNMQYKFQLFRFSFFQFINRVVVIPVATQRQVRTAFSVQRTVVIPRVQFLDLGVVPQVQLCEVVDVSVIMQRQVSGFPGRWSMYLLCRSSFGRLWRKSRK